MKLTIIILNFNTKKITSACLESIYAQKLKFDYRIVVVDNASSDGSVSYLRSKYRNLLIMESKTNLGFSGGNNLAIRKYFTTSDYVLLLNSDTIVKVGAIERLVEHAQKFNLGITSCKLLNSDGTFQANGGELPTSIPTFIWLSGTDDLLRKLLKVSSYQQRDLSYFQNTKDLGWVGGAAMLVHASVFSKIGLLDEKIFMYGEDVEFCLRAKKAGFKIGWTDSSEVIHLGGASSKAPKFTQWLGEFRGLLYIYRKHYGVLATFALKLFMYFFIALRAVVFFILGRRETAFAYAKILTKI